jgi:hypothetical protein
VRPVAELVETPVVELVGTLAPVVETPNRGIRTGRRNASRREAALGGE